MTRLQLAIWALTIAIGSPLWAQNSVFPSSHWGGTTYPDLVPTQRVGAHFFGFTQYGKEIVGKKGPYSFEPYNDIDETLGFNLLAVSNTRALDRRTPRSSMTYRGMVFVGAIDDHIPRFLQNEVAHSWFRDLRPVPRDTTDTYDPDTTSLGSSGPALLGYAGEVNLRLMSWISSDLRVPTGFFFGTGFAVSTIQHEIYGQFGGVHFKSWDMPTIPGRFLFDLRTLDVSATSRFGVLLPGRVFDDIASRYVTVQGTISAVFRFWVDYPVYVDYSISSTSGMFVRQRIVAERAQLTQDNDDKKDTYQHKQPLKERYYALKARIGSFEFETYNDSQGGKDKGPSFGARFSLVVTPDYKILSSWIGRL